MLPIDEKLLTVKTFGPKTMLVREGEVPDELMLITRGCIRAWYNAAGQDITLQFFFEGEPVTALESFLNQTPSAIYMETLEECEVRILKRADFVLLMATSADLKDWFYSTAIEKLLAHTHQLLFLLKNKPFDRYRQLLAEKPALLQRIPQHYIASYLGITPVSLSRIRNRSKNIS